MSDTHQVPPDVSDSAARVQQRDYRSDFARLPVTEVQRRTGPGGPADYVDARGPNKAMIVTAVGVLLTFAVFVINTPVLLVLGLLLMLVGTVMSIVAYRRHGRSGRSGGVGYTRVPDAPPSSR